MPALACFAAMVAVAATEQPTVRPLATDQAEEIVVTGERIQRSKHETASSVVVITAEQIEAGAALDRLDQLLDSLPNIELGSGGEGPTIRGQDSTGVLQALPAFLGGTRPRVTLQIDGRAASFNEFVFGVAPLWDIDRVEVFRTPQTTTQGRNAIAGAIFVETKDPEFGWHASGRLLVGHSDVRQGSAMLTGPIINDQLAIRFAGDIRRSKTSSTRADRIIGADPERDDYWLARIKLLARPEALPNGRLELTYGHVDTKAIQGEFIRPPFEERHDPLPGYGVIATDVDSITAVLDYDISQKIKTRVIASFGDAFIQRFAIAHFGETKTDVRDSSVEAVLNWIPNDVLSLTTGVHRLTQRLDQFIDLSLVFGTAEFDDRQYSLGLFGELNWTLVPKLTLTAGIRYQRDRQDREGLVVQEGPHAELDFDGSFDAWLPKLSIAYDFMDEFRAGILVQRAYNPGGLTLNLATGEPDTFRAETLWNYEAFARARLDGGRLRLAANLFYNKLRDAQRFQEVIVDLPGLPPVGLSEIDNAPRAHSYGLEVEGDWHLSPRLQLRASLGMLRTKLDETLSETDPILGKEFLRSPHLTVSTAIDWHPVEALRLSAQLRHHSGYYSDDENIEAFRIDPATVVDARAAWDAGPIMIFGYVRNVFDKFNLTSLSGPTEPIPVPNFGHAGDPRELGLGIEARF